MNLSLKISILLILFSTFLSCKKGSENEIVESTTYIVFTHRFFSPGTGNNSAVLITDSVLAKEISSLFIGNELKERCKCGYDYNIQFFDKDHNLIFYTALNTETDVFKKHQAKIKEWMKSLKYQINNSPTDYIYNLTINSSVPPSSIIESLKEYNMQCFPLGNINDYCPAIKLTYSKSFNDTESLNDTESTFNEIVKQISFIDRISIDSSSLYRSTKIDSLTANSRVNKISRIYYFSSETNTDSLKNKIDLYKINYLQVESLNKTYLIQLLYKNKDIDKITDILKDENRIINISAADEGFSVTQN